METEILSRTQFGFSVGFHIIWSTLTIGLVLFLVIVEAAWLRTRKKVYVELYQFWVKIFALGFGIGVVTGIPLAYQFGTNFSVFSIEAGSVIGPLVGVEVMTAFFLEAAFVGVMLFGWGRINPKLHFLATLFVALGSHNSAIWIIAANSWMQTPAGFSIVDGEMIVNSWKEVILNPSFPLRLMHAVCACYVTVAVLVAAVSSILLLRNPAEATARKGLKIAVLTMAVAVPLQLYLGDSQGLVTKEYQPAKIAAIEGIWETQKGAPSVLFAIPDMKEQRNRFAIEVPKLSSILLTHSLDGEIQGLKEFIEDGSGIPYVPLVFFSFRVMVGLGLLFLLLTVIGVYLLWRKRLYDTRWYHQIFRLCAPLGFIAVIAGWITTEAGRQPWIIYNIMRTADAVSDIPPENVLFSLTGFVLVYAVMLCTFLLYVRHVIRQGPQPLKEDTWLQLATHTAHVTAKETEQDQEKKP